MEHRRSLARHPAVTELRRALPFLLLPLLMLALGCNLLPPDLLGNPTPPPVPVAEATLEPAMDGATPGHGSSVGVRPFSLAP